MKEFSNVWCAVIDLDSIIFSAGAPNKKFDENGNPLRVDNKFVYEDKNAEQLIESARFLMSNIISTTNSTHYIALVKGRNTTKARLDINSEYKQNRKKETPIWFNFIKDYYITEWGAVEVNNIEVDDAVNITRLNIPNSFICAIDKDLLNLGGYHYNWRKSEYIDVSSKESEKYFWKSMITGDSVDNIKGIPNKGSKFADIALAGNSEYRNIVLDLYCKFFKKEEVGIKEFYKNYFSLKILDSYEGFGIPKPIEIKLNEFKT